jgi:hypothetical protein
MSDLYGVSRRRIVGETSFWILIVLGAIVLLTLLGLGWRYVLADPKGRVQAQEQIKSGSSRIAAYNHFFDLCAGVQSDEATMASLREELTTGPSESRRGQIQATLTALRSARAEKINQYNADARKDYTIGQFRSSGLPYTLDATLEATSCTP